MKIKMLKTVVVKGHPGIKAGDVVDVAPGLASYLVSDRMADFAADDVIQTREPVIESREPVVETPLGKPARRLRAK